MGTRSIVTVKDENGDKIIEMYRQFDGYPNGAGADYKKFCKSGTMVNGIQLGENNRVFNGMSCLAAQLVAEFKNGPGGYYLHAPSTDYVNKKKYYDMYCAEYYYEIILKEDELFIRCWDTYDNKELLLEEII